MNTLLRVGRVLELSESTKHADCLHTSRQKAIDQLPRLQRHSAQTILALTTRYPETGRRSLSKIASLRGYSFIGSGVEYSAYLRKQDSRVVKVNRASAGLSVAQLAELKDQVDSQYSLVTSYLGGIVTESEAYIDEHILGGGHQVLQIEQQLVDTRTYPAPFTSQTPDVNIADISNIVNDVAGADVALGEFCLGAREMFEKEHTLPDTNGKDNLVIESDGSLKLIDTIPINSSHPAVQELIMQQINSLEVALREVA